MTETATINWVTDWDEAQGTARSEKKPMMIYVFQENCGGCDRMEQETFTSPGVIRAINERFVPLKLHLFHDRAVVRQWGLFWTPTILFGDRSGKIRYDSINYLPPEEFLDVLDIGEARVGMRWKEFEKAIELLQGIEERHPDGAMTAEAIYWRGMAAYFNEKSSSEASKRVWAELVEKFPDSIWAKRQHFF
jgi:thioredoxin-related protein